jgi:hypothetical protein
LFEGRLLELGFDDGNVEGIALSDGCTVGVREGARDGYTVGRPLGKPEGVAAMLGNVEGCTESVSADSTESEYGSSKSLGKIIFSKHPSLCALIP